MTMLQSKHGAMVQRLARRPFTAETRVRFSLALPSLLSSLLSSNTLHAVERGRTSSNFNPDLSMTYDVVGRLCRFERAAC
jgi:hypothetical protein